MKNLRNYSENEVVKQLSHKHDALIDERRKLVFMLTENGKHDLGIKSKGKISFLKNYCGYRVNKVGLKAFNMQKELVCK